MNKEELSKYNELQDKLLTALRKLQREHGGWIISGDELSVFTKALSIEDPSRRLLVLEEMEQELSEYATYWFYRAEAAMEAKNYETADKNLAKFMATWKPVLKRDPYMAEAMRCRIGILMHNGVNYGNVEEILSCLSNMIAHTQADNWENYFFAGKTYFSLGHKEEAHKHVRIASSFNQKNDEISELLKRIEKNDIPPKIEPLSDEYFVNLCEAGDTKKVKEALKLGANVNAKDMDGMTALMYTESAEVAELLLTRGVDVNAKDNHGRTALMWTKNAEVAKLLLEHRADVNAKDKNGTTALMWAAKHGNAEIAELFLIHGAKVNLKKDGAITLMMARNTAVAELLLIQGAKVNVKDENGITALMWAEERCHTKIASILRTHGAK